MTSATHVSIPILCRCLRSFIHLARPGLHRFCWAVEAGTTPRSRGPGGPGDDTQNRFGAHAGGDYSSSWQWHVSIDSTYRYIWLEKIQSRTRTS